MNPKTLNPHAATKVFEAAAFSDPSARAAMVERGIQAHVAESMVGVFEDKGSLLW